MAGALLLRLLALVCVAEAASLALRVHMRSLATLCVAGSLAIIPSVSIADVGEGDLPAGAMAFSKLVKYQSDWRTVADTVRTRKDSMDDKEKLNIKFFLKQLANEYYDMDLLSNSIGDKSKADQAKLIAKDFRVLVRSCDDAVSAGNLGKIDELYPKTSEQLNEFFALMSDVPDEI